MIIRQLCTVELPIFCSVVYFVVSVLLRRFWLNYRWYC